MGLKKKRKLKSKFKISDIVKFAVFFFHDVKLALKTRKVKLYERSDEEFKQIVMKYINKYSPMFGETPKVEFKNLPGVFGRTDDVYNKKTGTWSHTIILNPALKYLPEHLIEYVVVHELIHLKYTGHGPEFHKELLRILPDADKRSIESTIYGIKLMKRGLIKPFPFQKRFIRLVTLFAR